VPDALPLARRWPVGQRVRALWPADARACRCDRLRGRVNCLAAFSLAGFLLSATWLFIAIVREDHTDVKPVAVLSLAFLLMATSVLW
jgi:hypothetical protein